MYKKYIGSFALLVLLTALGLSAIGFSKPVAYRLRLGAKSIAANKILRSCNGFNISKTKDSVIYYTKGDAKYVKLTEGIIKTYYPLLASDINLSVKKPVTAIIYPSREEMLTAVGYKKAGGTLPMGAYTAGILVILSPSAWLDDGSDFANMENFIKNGPLIHELTHLVFDEKTKGNYKTWFSEGVALYYENKYTGYIWDTKRNPDKAATFGELSDNFNYLNQRESYRKSGEIIKYIVNKKGEPALKSIFDDLEKGVPLNKSIEKQLESKLYIFDYL